MTIGMFSVWYMEFDMADHEGVIFIWYKESDLASNNRDLAENPDQSLYHRHLDPQRLTKMQSLAVRAGPRTVASQILKNKMN